MKSIAVLIDGSDNDDTSLHSAAALAKMAGARLTVFHNKMPDVLTAGTYDMAVAAIDNSGPAREALERARAAFDHECKGIAKARFVEVDARATEVLEMATPYNDLLLLERLSSAEGPDAVALNSALWDARSAVLVMPPQPVDTEIKKVVLAWNGSAQSGRALRAALPLIQAAGSLTVLSRVGTERDPELEDYLEAQGIRIEAWKTYGDPSLSARGWARALLAEVKDLDADMLVMGAFASGVGGFLGFGRATEKIATSTQIPVLFSA